MELIHIQDNEHAGLRSTRSRQVGCVERNRKTRIQTDSKWPILPQATQVRLLECGKISQGRRFTAANQNATRCRRYCILSLGEAFTRDSDTCTKALDAQTPLPRGGMRFEQMRAFTASNSSLSHFVTSLSVWTSPRQPGCLNAPHLKEPCVVFSSAFWSSYSAEYRGERKNNDWNHFTVTCVISLQTSEPRQTTKKTFSWTCHSPTDIKGCF